MTDENTRYEPDTPQSDLERRMIAEGLLDPREQMVAAVASGMVQQVLRTAFSMRVEDAESLARLSARTLKHARKVNHPDLQHYQQGAAAARAFLKFRRDLERLRQ